MISLGLNNYCKSQLLTWKKAQHLKHTTIPVVKSSMAGSVRSTAYGHIDTNKGSGRGRGNVDAASVGTNTPLQHQPENNQFQRYILYLSDLSTSFNSSFNTPPNTFKHHSTRLLIPSNTLSLDQYCDCYYNYPFLDACRRCFHPTRKTTKDSICLCFFPDDDNHHNNTSTATITTNHNYYLQL